jgi:hypothetical protein
MTTSLRRQPAPSPAPEEPAALALGPLLLVAALLAGLLLAVAGRYGYHRDELYFLAASHHLAWGYVDQPPLTPALAGVARLIDPDSLVVLRLLPALAVAAMVVVAGLIARELGGDRLVQVLTGACTAGIGVVVAAGHLLSTTTFDLLAWSVITWLLVRLLRTGDRRLWVPLGAAVGLGLLNKATVAQLAGVGLLALLTDRRGRHLLASRWPVAGSVVALAMWAPYLLWQATHGWPQLAIFADLRADDGGLGAGLAFLPLQLLMTNPLLAVVWVVGLVALLRWPELRPWRLLAVAWLLLVGFYTLVGGKPYYAAGLYPVLYAAGWLRVAAWRAARGRPARPRLVLAAVALAALLPVPLLLPVVPVSAVDVVGQVNEDSLETIGWPRYVAQIETARAALPAADQAEVVVVTGNYGEAGAVARFAGPWADGRVFSGHNSWWFWGPPPGDGRVVLVVGEDPAWLAGRFASVTLAGRLDNGLGIDNEEQGQPVWLARDLRGGWADWRAWRHYDG